jgi:hypothetical protein
MWQSETVQEFMEDRVAVAGAMVLVALILSAALPALVAPPIQAGPSSVKLLLKFRSR